MPKGRGFRAENQMTIWERMSIQEKSGFVFGFAKTLGVTRIELQGSIWTLHFSDGRVLQIPETEIFIAPDPMSVLHSLGDRKSVV